MTQIIITELGDKRKAYCAECADSKMEIQAELEKADNEGGLEISDQPEDALGVECVGCHRQVHQVRTESRSYKVKAKVIIEFEVDLEVASTLRLK